MGRDLVGTESGEGQVYAARNQWEVDVSQQEDAAVGIGSCAGVL